MKTVNNKTKQAKELKAIRMKKYYEKNRVEILRKKREKYHRKKMQAKNELSDMINSSEFHSNKVKLSTKNEGECSRKMSIDVSDDIVQSTSKFRKKEESTMNKSGKYKEYTSIVKTYLSKNIIKPQNQNVSMKS